ncbi:FAD-dependent monooxygenase [Methyloraptor flagellatus]|uniref:FAD-dependent monooxygenase n=1 Tax=Methyloraptor flagellatus TaxID=3162530 RepID=A0AAU7XCI0_9HYPH
MADALPLVIAGAGIGGLTAALALSRAGRRTIVLEQADRLAEVGAGIQLSPNASRILDALDLGLALDRHAVTPDWLKVHSVRAGGEVLRMPLGRGIEQRYGAPYRVIHRADLLDALATAAQTDRNVEIRLGTRLRRAEAAPGRISIEARTPTGPATIEAAALIGADGVRSRVRTHVLGGPLARYSGRTAYRAVVPIGQIPAEHRRSTGLWMGPHGHLVHYPLHGGETFNLVAVIESDWEDDGWSVPATRREVLDAFASWPQAARDLLALPQDWTKWALCGVDPDFAWVGGHVAVLGDAAHAMLPFAAQGGAMAIEDAAVLAAHLADPAADIAMALAAYEAERKPRAKAVVELARTNGRIYHLPDALAFLRDAGMRIAGADRLAARQDWIWRWRPPAETLSKSGGAKSAGGLRRSG